MCVVNVRFKDIQGNFANKQYLPTLKSKPGWDGNQLSSSALEMQYLVHSSYFLN